MIDTLNIKSLNHLFEEPQELESLSECCDMQIVNGSCSDCKEHAIDENYVDDHTTQDGYII